MKKKLFFALILIFSVSVVGYAEPLPDEPPPVDPGSEGLPPPPPGWAPISSYEWVLFTGAMLLGSYKLTQNIKNKKAPLK